MRTGQKNWHVTDYRAVTCTEKGQWRETVLYMSDCWVGASWSLLLHVHLLPYLLGEYLASGWQTLCEHQGAPGTGCGGEGTSDGVQVCDGIKSNEPSCSIRFICGTGSAANVIHMTPQWWHVHHPEWSGKREVQFAPWYVRSPTRESCCQSFRQTLDRHSKINVLNWTWWSWVFFWASWALYTQYIVTAFGNIREDLDLNLLPINNSAGGQPVVAWGVMRYWNKFVPLGRERTGGFLHSMFEELCCSLH